MSKGKRSVKMWMMRRRDGSFLPACGFSRESAWCSCEHYFRHDSGMPERRLILKRDGYRAVRVTVTWEDK